jgi:hypothetical protein
VTDLTSRADAIVIGSMATRNETADSVSFDITVLRTIKGGNLPPSVHVQHAWARKVSPSNSARSVIDVACTGVWFLRQESGGVGEVIPTSGPDGIFPSLFLPAVSALPAAYSYSSTAALTDSVLLELAAGLQSSSASPQTYLHAASSLNSPTVLSIFTAYTCLSDPEFQAVGLAGLLQRGSPGSIGMLRQLWPVVAVARGRVFITAAVRDYSRASDPQSVQDLVGLTTAKLSGDLRGAAINAVSAIHSRETLPYLATLLGSTDAGERMKGVFGLSSFANGLPSQTPGNAASLSYLTFPPSASYQTRKTKANFAFRRGPATEETNLVSFWQSWWQSHTELH